MTNAIFNLRRLFAAAMSLTVLLSSANICSAKAEKTSPTAPLGYDLSSKDSTEKPKTQGDITKLLINEVCPKNKKCLSDSDGDFSDWVEIYNPTDKPINLKGAALTDSSLTPLKWTFPSVNIKARGYLVVFCSDKDTKSPELHTNFKISGGSEEIILNSPSGKKIDSVIVANTAEDKTYGREKDGSAFKILTPTPGKSNSGSKTAESAGIVAPIMSAESGFYAEGFSLRLTAEAGTTIYYTTDGSVPTSASKKYSYPIKIQERKGEEKLMFKKDLTVDPSTEQTPYGGFEMANVIRAIAVNKNGETSPVSTSTYFVGKKTAEKYKDATVISVVSDPDGLYNQKTGIFVAGDTFKAWRKENPSEPLDGNSQANFNQRGIEWEREGHVEIFRGGELEASEACGIRTHGGWSRNSTQKSMKFYFRAEYGESKLKYELFEDNAAYDDGKVVKEYKRFMVRNGGNDSFCLLYKDAWTQACVQDFPFAVQASDAAVVFLDGEYWGLYTLNEVYDDHYIEENYGVNSDNAVMIKAGSLEEGEDGDYKLWEDACNFIRNNDMSKEANYKKACEYFDMTSFTEYLALEYYISNDDWLWNNWAAWRARETSDTKYHDGKWRFMCYDTEFSMDLYSSGSNYRANIMAESVKKGDGHLGPLVVSLLKNSDFKSKLVVSLEDVMNIAFNPKSAAELLDEFHEEYAPYIPQHFKRYVFWQSLQGIEQNRDSWKKWLQKRYDYMPTQIKENLGLTTDKTNNLSISVNGAGGTVKINGIPLQFTDSKWTGHYLSGYHLTVEAVPESGYEFTGWTGGYTGSSKTLTINPSRDFELTANFKKK